MDLLNQIADIGNEVRDLKASLEELQLAQDLHMAAVLGPSFLRVADFANSTLIETLFKEYEKRITDLEALAYEIMRNGNSTI